MSERFSDEVLQRAIEAYERGCWTPAPAPDAPVVCVLPDRQAGYAAMRAALEGQTCEWSMDEDSSTWETSCGKVFQFTEDGPKENGTVFCCYCGQRCVFSAASDGSPR